MTGCFALRRLWCLVSAVGLVRPGTGQGQWLNMGIQNPAPMGRYRASMACDFTRGETVLYGGRNIGGTVLFGDTWEWNGARWVQRLGSASPGLRYEHTMADDVSRRILLFGGLVQGGLASADTWVWDGVVWQQLQPAVSPSARNGHAMVYDSQRQRVVLFGGIGAAGLLGDAWEWDGAAWRLVSTAGPTPRSSPAMAYDARRGRTVLFGGTTLGFGTPNDTWEWDGTQWTLTHPTSAPQGRGYGSMAYDSGRGRCVLFGGLGTGASTLGDTWEWDGTDWVHMTAGPSPMPAWGASMAFDSRRQRAVLFEFPQGIQQTWEYFAACSTVGPGSTSGGLPCQCSAVPRVGQPVCISFPSALGWGVLLLDRAPALWPTPFLDPPFLCQRSFLYPNPALAFVVAGNPAQWCNSLANDPLLIGQAFCLQGFSLNGAGCLDATDGVVIVIQP